MDDTFAWRLNSIPYVLEIFRVLDVPGCSVIGR